MPDVLDSSYFQSARKLAVKEYSKSTSKGEVGYLPSLEGLIKNSDIVSEVNLGVIEIPLKKIIGTYLVAVSREGRDSNDDGGIRPRGRVEAPHPGGQHLGRRLAGHHGYPAGEAAVRPRYRKARDEKIHRGTAGALRRRDNEAIHPPGPAGGGDADW